MALLDREPVDEDDPTPVRRIIDREWDDLDWQADAACVDAETDLFFAPVMEPASERDAREAYVLDEFCSRCPVRRECRDFGRRHREFGVWGETEADRARAGRAPDTITRKELQRLRQVARLEREGLVAR
jgi:hypothetical protein